MEVLADLVLILVADPERSDSPEKVALERYLHGLLRVLVRMHPDTVSWHPGLVHRPDLAGQVFVGSQALWESQIVVPVDWSLSGYLQVPV
jgi:hypothetical protein